MAYYLYMTGEVKAQLRMAYGPYHDEIEDIAAWAAAATKQFGMIKRVPGYINSGEECDVFQLSDPDLVVKLPYGRPDRGQSPWQLTRDCVQAMVSAAGCQGLAQIKAYNDTARRGRYAIVAEYVPGPLLSELSYKQRLAIPPSRYGGLLEVFESMQERNLGLDAISENVKYNRQGFVVIDYDLNARQTFSRKVLDFGGERMLLDNTPKGRLPDYGLTYRTVCEEMYGAYIGRALDRQWQREQFILPL